MEYGRINTFDTMKNKLKRSKSPLCLTIFAIFSLYVISGKSHEINVGLQEKFVYPEVFNDAKRDNFVAGTFPENFKFGAATAAYQIEGAWNVDGKGPSIWDIFTHIPGKTLNSVTGDDADRSYFHWDDDVRMLQSLGVDFYRFSLSWSRILPNGFYEGESSINEAGVKFYSQAIDMLIEAGIDPMITLYHWDLPQGIQEKGGMRDSEFPRWFSDYARLCFKLFGDRVKTWITFNEPLVVAECFEGGGCAPGIYSPGVGSYEVMHQMLLAHQEAYHLYNREFRDTQKGEVGFVINTPYTQPIDQSPENVAAAERVNEFTMGILLSPLLGTGDYPEIMKTIIADVSAKQGFEKSRLPEFSEQEKKLLFGSVDFIGLNHYALQLGREIERKIDPIPSLVGDRSIEIIIPPEWPQGASGWFHVAPYGFRDMLNWVQDRYGKLGTRWYITENGYSDFPDKGEACSNLKDTDRVKYITSHINQIYRAITEDNIRVEKFAMWSLMDNLEWTDGYTIKFGIFCVNFNDPMRFRHPRWSVDVYRKMIQDRGFSQSLVAELEEKEILRYAKTAAADDEKE